MNIEIPPGLTAMLQEFTVSVLRHKPPDLVKYAQEYFKNLYERQSNSRDCIGSPVCKQKKTASISTAVIDSTSSMGSPVPPKNFNRRKSVASERYDPEADNEPYTKIVHRKSMQQKETLRATLQNILLFKSLEPEQMEDCIDAMFQRDVQKGEKVIQEGDDGDNFYIIESGVYDIFVGGKKYGSYNNSGNFGELALMYNQPRAATIVATTPGLLWAMERSVFRQIVLKSAYQRRKMYESLLEKVPLLQSLNQYERMNVADALQTKYFQDGDIILKQGDTADCMYFVERGKVHIVAEKGNQEKEVAIVEEGGYFGELALVTHQPRAASAIAEGTVKCAVLDVAAFERLMGPCMDVMKRNIASYDDQMKQIFKTDN